MHVTQLVFTFYPLQKQHGHMSIMRGVGVKPLCGVCTTNRVHWREKEASGQHLLVVVVTVYIK